jgi:hypothetical protein
MHTSYYKCLLVLLLLPLLVPLPAQADYYGRSELDQLVAPIALYPDPLLAQLLPASTFVDQIQDADSYVGTNGYRYVDDQDWDISVRALCHYPSVLDMMSQRVDWTTALGQAYIDQPDDVMDAIQRERHRAYDYGWLRSTSRIEVIVESGGFIRIDPADPSYIYVPTYDPDVVFVRRARHDELRNNILSFGLGFLIGSWLNRDTDWDHHRVFYHGWNGGGWVGRSRSHVTINRIYVNNTYVNQPVRVNRSVTTRDITPYRTRLKSNVGTLKPPTPAPTVNRTPQPRNGRVGGQTWTNRQGTTNNRTNRTLSPSNNTTGVGGNVPTTNRRERTGGATGSYQRGGSMNQPTVQSNPTGRPTRSYNEVAM